MRAAVHTKYGPPEVVRIEEVPEPRIGDGDLLVRVRLATVNRTDCGFRAAKPFFVRLFSGLTGPKHPVLGTEFAGVVAAVGASVTSFAVGDRVFGYSEDRFGAQAEYLTIPADGPVATIPADVSDELAAASTEASHYALTTIRKTKIRGGQDVLVYGATGAIGTAAVQLLKTVGATVTAVCDTATMDLVNGLGADRVVDRTAVDFTEDSRRYDVVFDAVGKSSFGQCRHLLKPGGTYASTDLGPGAQNPVLSLVTPLFRGKKARLPIPAKFDQELALYFRGLLESGEFRPVIDRQYDLDQIVAAYRYVETGLKVGNVLIAVDPA